jgi:hypothetical protein
VALAYVCMPAYAQAQRRLELLLNSEESLTRMENLLEVRTSDKHGLTRDHKDLAVVLERIANESARLTGQVRVCAHVHACVPRHALAS